MSMAEQLSALMEKYTKLQAENKQLKAWQKVMQNEVDTSREAELELLALRDETKQLNEDIKEWREYKKGIDELLKGNKKEFKQLLAENEQLKEFIKWGEREEVYETWLKEVKAVASIRLQEEEQANSCR